MLGLITKLTSKYRGNTYIYIYRPVVVDLGVHLWGITISISFTNKPINRIPNFPIFLICLTGICNFSDTDKLHKEYADCD